MTLAAAAANALSFFLGTRFSRSDMRTEQGLPVRLADYRPPDWLVDTVDLDR